MTRQTWTSFVSALVFVGLAVLLAVAPVPFVTWGPGDTHDTLGQVGSEPMISVQGIPSYPTSGRLDLTVVSVTPADARLSLPQALLAYWLPNRDTLPRDAIYARTTSAEEIERQDAELMETAQDDAVVAALRAARQPVTEMPAVYAVTVGGPAHRRLQPGDLVQAVDGVPTPTSDAVRAQIRTRQPGDELTFEVLRQRRAVEVRVRAAPSNAAEAVPVVGIEIGPGYRYTPDISVELGSKIGGPSAGLVFALAIYDRITDGPLLAGAHVAGTGTITPTGDVGPIGGIQEKIAGADRAGAGVFLVPAGNCGDLAGVSTEMTLVRVGTLADAVSALETLATPGGADRVPRC